ncbi:TonB-dependent receptor [uncultured Bacteroides sp.]|uniref:OmpP1/FadL family transporter n=1 Tax=uncultured Bacteroides sp. TaxID=162156 RepID=UPI0025DB96E1|nr:TonB-dependent receptor [uncultured Bacteroides sp.]
MKKITTFIYALSLVVGTATAQSVYDGAKITDKDLNGTARFVGMGGAMGALGGDITTMGTNPAGIGIYRSHDVATSFSYSAHGMESNYEGNKFSINKNRWAFDNVGVVFATKIGNRTPLRYVNFGFNYKRSKSFYKNMSMAGMMGIVENPLEPDAPYYVSQTNSMALQATDAERYVWDNSREHLDFGEAKKVLSNPNAGWLGALGYLGGLTERDRLDNEPDLYIPFLPVEPSSAFDSREKGGISEYDFNVSFNINDRVYLGLTVGSYDVDYNKYSGYDESYDRGEGYSLESYNKMIGHGFDVKMGLILRPFEYSPFRIGLAVHTPTFYNLTYTTSAIVTNDYRDFETDELKRIMVDTYDYVGDMQRDYRLVTPWKYNVSLGYTVGSSLALGAEYEYEDYSTMKFKYSGNEGGGDMEFENAEVKNCLKGEHTFRIGAEYKVVPQFAFRLGYNYSSAMFKNEAVKYIPSNSLITDTDFSNKKSQNNYTLGIGYRGKMFYADLAYQLSTYKEDFYPFYNEFELNSNEWTMVTAPATKVTNTRSQVLLTLGMRF